MLTEDQAKQLKEAGLTAYVSFAWLILYPLILFLSYNHNLDTSREYYPKVVSTRTYDDRLKTVENVRKAGISVCCGGIIGMGEEDSDRVGLLHTIATMPGKI